jgi:hypothetical protein
MDGHAGSRQARPIIMEGMAMIHWLNLVAYLFIKQ